MPDQKNESIFSGFFEKPLPKIGSNIILLAMNISLVSIYYLQTEKKLILPLVFTSLVTIAVINYLLYRHDNSQFKVHIPVLLISIFITLSFMIPIIDTSEFPLISYILFGAALLINSYLICMVLRDMILSAKLKQNINRMRWWDLPLFMTIAMAINGFAFLGVFPGVTWFDSAYCWSMAIRTSYSDAHPILYLMLMRGLYLIWDNIAIVTIFQLVLVSFTYGYTAYRLKQIGLHTKLCFVLVFLLSIIPSNLITNIQVLKDIPYTMGLILFSIEIIRILVDKDYFKKFYNYVLIIFWVMIVIATRHNGIFIIGLSFAFLLIYFFKNSFRKIAYKLIYVFIVTALLFVSLKEYSINNVRIFSVDEPNSYGAYTIPVQGLMEVYDKHYDEMDEVEKGVLTKYLNEDFAKEYIQTNRLSRYWQFHGLYQNALDGQMMKGNEAEFMKTYMHYLKKYPKDIIMSYLRITGIVWSVPEYNHTAYPEIQSFESDNDELFVPEPDSKSEASLSWLNIWHKTTQGDFGKVVFWRPALVLALIILIVAVKKNKVALYVILPALFNHLGYLFVIQAQDFRYFYADYTILPIVLILALLDIKDYYAGREEYSVSVALDKSQAERLLKAADVAKISKEEVMADYITEGLNGDKD